MGRKRNQGKARKAAKAKAKEEERGNNNNNTQVTDANGRQQSLAALLQQLQSGAASDTTLCRHGFEQIDKMCTDLVIAFRDAFYDNTDGGDADILDCLITAEDATMDKFADVWNDSAKMEIAISLLLSMGTQYVLYGNYDIARDFATFARYFEQYVAVKLHQTQAVMNCPKICETYMTISFDEECGYNPADLHTLVKLFRKRIPCCCLDEKYEEVKGVTKMGWCFNPQCNLLRVKRSKTMYCDRCRSVTYCSPECQRTHWPRHKPLCDTSAAQIAEFEAEQQNG